MVDTIKDSCKSKLKLNFIYINALLILDWVLIVLFIKKKLKLIYNNKISTYYSFSNYFSYKLDKFLI